MIAVLKTDLRPRTFGWTQDPGDWGSLCNVVSLFDPASSFHRKLRDELIPQKVEDPGLRERMRRLLDARPLRLPYGDLTGKGPRKGQSRTGLPCTGIVQAAVKGQKAPYISNWPADNFLRWAHDLHLIEYRYSDDSFAITAEGLALSAAGGGSGELTEEQLSRLGECLLAYPPAVRILELLQKAEGRTMTKFELGRRLGFPAEGGFTSLSQNLLLLELAENQREGRAGENNALVQNWEGSSDKYARTIAGWLAKLGLVRQEAKAFYVEAGGQSVSIPHAYRITAKGSEAYRRSLGGSRHKRIPKFVCWEMLATNVQSRNYLRTRRAYVLKCLAEAKGWVTPERIAASLLENGLEASQETAAEDAEGLRRIGLRIEAGPEGYRLLDELGDFIIPLHKDLEKPDLAKLREELKAALHRVPHEFLCLLDLARDGQQNRVLEIKVMELLTDVCGFSGRHLGGSRRPDGIAYTRGLTEDYGVIVDTKAYGGDYSLPISQADEMLRYVEENQNRDPAAGDGRWWLHFPKDVSRFYFLFISGDFTAGVPRQLAEISRRRGVQGGALPVVDLLLLSEALLSGSMTYEDFARRVFRNEIYRMPGAGNGPEQLRLF